MSFDQHSCKQLMAKVVFVELRPNKSQSGIILFYDTGVVFYIITQSETSLALLIWSHSVHVDASMHQL